MTTHTDDSLGSIHVLPCPFCGSSGLLETCPAESTQRELFWVECKGDNCGISGRIRYTANDAINAWNRRPAPEAAVRMLELVREYGESRWSEGCSAGTYLDRVGERRAREEAADLFKQIESAVNGLTLGAAAPAGGETTLSDINELAKVYASSYASPHHMTFTVDGLRELFAALIFAGARHA